MHTIVRGLGRNLSDPGSAVSVVIGVVVGALLGGAYESRTPPTPCRPADARGTRATGTPNTHCALVSAIAQVGKGASSESVGCRGARYGA